MAVLWTAAKVTGVPRPLEDLLKCSRAEERRVRRVAWRLKEEARLGLVHIRLDAYEDRLREVYRPKGLLAYAAAAREYVRML